MRVEVRQKHIDQALALRAARGGASGHECPIALAMKEQTKIPVLASASVGVDSAALFMAGQKVGEYTLSQSAQRFVEDFDHDRHVEPRTFMLVEVK